jgi:hydrogenase expression/formation protein HypE
MFKPMTDRGMPLLPGKLPPDVLASLLARLPADQRVVVGPRVGEDAAVIDMGDRYLVAKTDPITFATDQIGWYAVQVNANDLATMGATPRWFMLSTLLPAGAADTALAERIFDQVLEACQVLEIALIGGHTEITTGIDRPLVTGVMLGEVARDRLITSAGARPGDDILLTKGVPIEAISILAREKRAELLTHFDAAFIDRAAAFLTDPGISVVRDARIACAAGKVTAMHDPTEGGLATALWELADACGLQVVIDSVTWPIYDEGTQLCAFFGLDPLGAIASGALLLTVDPASTGPVMDALGREDIPVFRLGSVQPGQPDVLAHGERLTRPARDEIARLLT